MSLRKLLLSGRANSKDQAVRAGAKKNSTKKNVGIAGVERKKRGKGDCDRPKKKPPGERCDLVITTVIVVVKYA